MPTQDKKQPTTTVSLPKDKNANPEQGKETSPTGNPPHKPGQPPAKGDKEQADAQASVSAKKSRTDLVTITVYEDIEPPPRIGDWDGKHELGITKMKAKNSYKVPRNVAEVIADAKKGTIVD